MSRKRAFEMLFLGEALDAQTAAILDLVNWVVDASMLQEHTAVICHQLTAMAPRVLREGKRLFRRQLEQDEFSALALASGCMSAWSRRDEAQVGIRDFLASRRARSTPDQ